MSGPNPDHYQPCGCAKMYGDLVDGEWRCRRCAALKSLNPPPWVIERIEAGRPKLDGS